MRLFDSLRHCSFFFLFTQSCDHRSLGIKIKIIILKKDQYLKFTSEANLGV